MTSSVELVSELKLRQQIAEDHDTECALKAGEFIELGFMGEEFSNYGTGYLEHDRVKYFVCSNEQTMQRFRWNCFKEGLCMTRVIYSVERYHVPIGRNDFIKEQVRKNLAASLKTSYGTLFFQALKDCQNTMQISDVAGEILTPLLTKLRNSLDEQLIQIVRGLAEDAYEMKKLSRSNFWHIMKWVHQEQKNVDIICYGNERYRRTYYGFCSKKQGKIRYYVNASRFTVQQKRRDLIGHGEIVSPILGKTYFVDEQSRLISCRREFIKLLEKYLDDTFMNDLQMLWKLPSAVNIGVYQQGLCNLEITGCVESLEDYLYYGYIWNAID